jgi:hypothetical protein
MTSYVVSGLSRTVVLSALSRTVVLSGSRTVTVRLKADTTYTCANH